MSDILPPILCCFFQIPQEERDKRLQTIDCLSQEIPIHKSNTNGLNDKKDIVIQSMFKNK